MGAQPRWTLAAVAFAAALLCFVDVIWTAGLSVWPAQARRWWLDQLKVADAVGPIRGFSVAVCAPCWLTSIEWWRPRGRVYHYLSPRTGPAALV
jgi:hypothetical protein